MYGSNLAHPDLHQHVEFDGELRLNSRGVPHRLSLFSELHHLFEFTSLRISMPWAGSATRCFTSFASEDPMPPCFDYQLKRACSPMPYLRTMSVMLRHLSGSI